MILIFGTAGMLYRGRVQVRMRYSRVRQGVAQSQSTDGDQEVDGYR